VDYHEDLLFTDLALFNRKLADWLVVSDAERPHHSLGQQSPLSLPTCNINPSAKGTGLIQAFDILPGLSLYLYSASEQEPTHACYTTACRSGSPP
jgi:hypothetical protein